jgi:metal-dependent hydrolase (beta-lactamase superfamily II)
VLVLKVPGGLLLVCGCCHAGLLNTVRCVEQIFAAETIGIAGGTHLAAANEAQIRRVGRIFREAATDGALAKSLFGRMDGR